jgi:hypothetical protein
VILGILKKKETIDILIGLVSEGMRIIQSMDIAVCWFRGIGSCGLP